MTVKVRIRFWWRMGKLESYRWNALQSTECMVWCRPKCYTY